MPKSAIRAKAERNRGKLFGFSNWRYLRNLVLFCWHKHTRNAVFPRFHQHGSCLPSPHLEHSPSLSAKMAASNIVVFGGDHSGPEVCRPLPLCLSPSCGFPSGNWRSLCSSVHLSNAHLCVALHIGRCRGSQGKRALFGPPLSCSSQAGVPFRLMLTTACATP